MFCMQWKILKNKEKTLRNWEGNWCFTRTNNKKGQFHSEFCMRVCSWNMKPPDIFKPYNHFFYPLLTNKHTCLSKNGWNTILVLDISCILEHQKDKPLTEPISWGENMFGEKHSIHLQDQHSDPYHIYYKKKKLSLIILFFFPFHFLRFQFFPFKYINNHYNIPIDLFHSLHEHGPIKRFFYFHNTC